jgi:signal transduction histidine kinase
MHINYELIFESLPGMYYLLRPDFTIAAVSDVFLRATMTTREILIEKYLFDVFPENPAENGARGEASMRSSLKYVLDHKIAHTMAVLKYDIRTPDGKYETRYWSPLNQPVLDENKNIIYIIHQVKDVTDLMRKQTQSKEARAYQLKEIATEYEAELYQRAQEIQKINSDLINEVNDRKLAEEKARATQALLQATIESHKDLLIFSIDRNYCYLIFNAAFRISTFNVYGTMIETGSSLLECITVEQDRLKAKTNLDRALAGENHVTVEQYGDTHRFYFETRYTPILGGDKEVIGVTVQSANITDRKRAEDQIYSLNQELESFTYSVAHDLRAPLRAIDGYTELLKQGYSAKFDGEGDRLLGVIMKNAKRMGKLIDDLLDFSRLGKLSIRHSPVDMNSMVATVLSEQFEMCKHKVKFNIGDLEVSRCDSNLIRHVVTNLLSNAIKYSQLQAFPEISIGSMKSATEVIYFFRDNGVGFDMQYVDKLFGVFQRLHKATEFEGTGVGLAIVQRIITKHGGRVWAEGELGKGATFYFSLPL